MKDKYKGTQAGQEGPDGRPGESQHGGEGSGSAGQTCLNLMAKGQES